MSNETSRTTDGTEPAEPSLTFADPLSGLVGSQHAYPSATTAQDGDAPRPAVAGTSAPDPETVRGLLDGVFAAHPAERGADQRDDETAEPGAAIAGEGEPVRPVERPADEHRPGLLPARQRRRTWPSRRRLTRQAWRPRRRSAIRRPRPTVGGPQVRKPTRGSAGVAVAIALLLLFCFVAIEFVVSLFDTFAGIGG